MCLTRPKNFVANTENRTRGGFSSETLFLNTRSSTELSTKVLRDSTVPLRSDSSSLTFLVGGSTCRSRRQFDTPCTTSQQGTPTPSTLSLGEVRVGNIHLPVAVRESMNLDPGRTPYTHSVGTGDDVTKIRSEFLFYQDSVFETFLCTFSFLFVHL